MKLLIGVVVSLGVLAWIRYAQQADREWHAADFATRYRRLYAIPNRQLVQERDADEYPVGI